MAATLEHITRLPSSPNFRQISACAAVWAACSTGRQALDSSAPPDASPAEKRPGDLLGLDDDPTGPSQPCICTDDSGQRVDQIDVPDYLERLERPKANALFWQLLACYPARSWSLCRNLKAIREVFLFSLRSTQWDEPRLFTFPNEGREATEVRGVGVSNGFLTPSSLRDSSGVGRLAHILQRGLRFHHQTLSSQTRRSRRLERQPLSISIISRRNPTEVIITRRFDASRSSTANSDLGASP